LQRFLHSFQKIKNYLHFEKLTAKRSNNSGVWEGQGGVTTITIEGNNNLGSEGKAPPAGVQRRFKNKASNAAAIFFFFKKSIVNDILQPSTF